MNVMKQSNNSPEKVLSRLIHSDYFDLITPYGMKYFQPKIDKHMDKCKHPKCVQKKDDIIESIMIASFCGVNDESNTT